ncbi:MAG: hypothetical protein AB7S38_36740 [Vulcanimicrobiota bacterium]
MSDRRALWARLGLAGEPDFTSPHPGQLHTGAALRQGLDPHRLLARASADPWLDDCHLRPPGILVARLAPLALWRAAHQPWLAVPRGQPEMEGPESPRRRLVEECLARLGSSARVRVAPGELVGATRQARFEALAVAPRRPLTRASVSLREVEYAALRAARLPSPGQPPGPSQAVDHEQLAWLEHGRWLYELAGQRGRPDWLVNWLVETARRLDVYYRHQAIFLAPEREARLAIWHGYGRALDQIGQDLGLG